MYKNIRIAILLTILVIVAGNQWLTGSRFSHWEKPLWITIYPVLVDSDAKIRRYVENLTADSFQEIGIFLTQQAARYGLQLDEPVVIQVARPLMVLPPPLPVENSGWKVGLWSLKMRWWSWKNGGQDGLAPDDIRMYVLYQKRREDSPMERSVGIKKGSYGVVNAVASRHLAARNRIVISHELMHILGATDKYDFGTHQPLAPHGLANPKKIPPYPQNRAEIMAGRIASSPDTWRYPASLRYCVIGESTATEIGWLQD